MDADLEALAGIIELLERAEFTQFSFEQGDLRIAVSRGGAPLPGFGEGSAPAQVAPPQAVPAGSVQSAPAPVVPAAPAPPETGEIVLGEGESLVRSPLLGTFYRASKPGAPAFVEPGDAVDAEATVCIIEVMKLMNSVPAGVAGEVVRVLARDGDLVEFDQPLLVIRSAP